MANKKKNYWYVLVMTDNGPVFVTSVEYSSKTAHWNNTEKPLEMDMSRAKDLVLGLNLNFHAAFTVCQPFEIDSQPYIYSKGKFVWAWNEDEKEEE